jgi:hypothetical protein
MLAFTYIRAAVVAVVFAALTLSSGASPQRSQALEDRQSININAPDNLHTLLSRAFADSGELVIDDADVAELTPATPDPLSRTSTFYSVRPDVRDCVSPMCGGYFVKRVNMSVTRCANGRYMRECYVAEIDWNGQPQVNAPKALLRGSIVAKRYEHFSKLGVLRVNESWQAASDQPPVGVFYLIRDRGLRCITFPCLTHYAAKLNSTFVRNIAGVDLTGARAGDEQVSEALAAMTGADGVIVAGNHATVTGPGGRALELKATQFYLRAGKRVVTGPPVTRPPTGRKCFKTGCGGQVCADKDVITTCEWRPEYECYKKATCERQADGNCGFTKTPELTSCLAGK